MALCQYTEWGWGGVGGGVCTFEFRLAASSIYLSQLCDLSRVRLPYNDHHAIVPDNVQQLVSHSKYGQVLVLFFEGLTIGKNSQRDYRS